MKTSIAIITLNPASAQVQELSNFLSNQGLANEIIQGVDGRKSFPILEENEHVDRNETLKMRFGELTKSEVGCYLSHFRTIKKMYNSGIDRLCILEDDVLIEPNFSHVFNELKILPDEFEHVRLMGLKRHKRKDIFKIGTDHRLTRPVKGLCGTQGYILSRSGMKKILTRGHVIAAPIDKFYDHFWDIDLKSYCVEPHIIWERNIIKSSIVKSSTRKATRSLGKFVQWHINKLKRGLKRRAYILKYWNDFLPANKQIGEIGRTARIR